MVKLADNPAADKTVVVKSKATVSANQPSPSATSAPTTNVSVKKLMTTNCNLKLRAAEATSSNVLTVMAQGTKVKILELGKAETIDGISSNWVKVEVQKGAKDKNGNAIKAGTAGWCYGGYLE